MYYQKEYYNSNQQFPENGQVYYPNLIPQTQQYGYQTYQTLNQQQTPQTPQQQPTLQTNIKPEAPEPEKKTCQDPDCTEKTCKRRRRNPCIICCSFFCFFLLGLVGVTLFFVFFGIKAGSVSRNPLVNDQQCVLATRRGTPYKEFSQRVLGKVRNVNVVLPQLNFSPRHTVTVSKSKREGVRVYAYVQSTDRFATNLFNMEVKNIQETATIAFKGPFSARGCPTITIDIQVSSDEELNSILINGTASTSVALDSITSKDININLLNRPAPNTFRHINITKVYSDNIKINAPSARANIRDVYSKKAGIVSINSQSANLANFDYNDKLEVNAVAQIDISNLKNAKEVTAKSSTGAIKYKIYDSQNTLFDLSSVSSEVHVQIYRGIEWFRNIFNIKQGKIMCNGECAKEITLKSESGSVLIEQLE